MMFTYVAFFCIVGAAFANPGILTPSLSIASAPAIVSSPSIGILRTAPIATIGAPIVSSGLVTGGLVSGGLLSNGLVSGGIVSGNLVSNGLISNGLLTKGLLAGGVVSEKLIR